MSRRKEDTELALAKAKTTLRSLVHLKHSLLAMEELNDLEPELEERFTAALNDNQPFVFDVKELVDRLDRS